MAVSYKDIDELSQKSSVAGTEKLPVSDTEYITPAQIVESCQSEEEIVRLIGGQAPFVKQPYMLAAENDEFTTSTTYYHAAIRVEPGEKYIITNHQDQSASTVYTRYAFATSASYSSGGDVPVVSGTHVVVMTAGASDVVTIPSGCNFLLVNYTETSNYTYDVVKCGENFKNETVYDYIKMTPTSTTSNSYFTPGGSISSNNNLALRKYSVTGGGLYAFSGRLVSGYAMFFVAWANSNDEVICIEPWKGSAFTSETTTIALQNIIAPPGAAYAYCNVQSSNNSALAIAVFFERQVVEGQKIKDYESTLLACLGYQELPYSISSSGTGKFGTNDTYWHAAFPVVPGEKYVITNTQTQDATWTRYAFVTSLSYESGGDIPFVTGTTDVAIALNASATVIIPDGCSYLLVSQTYATYAPISVRRDTSIPAIPTVPTISTSISDDANSDDKTASPKAVKTYVDGKIVYCATEADYTSITTKDSGTLYLIPKT